MELIEPDPAAGFVEALLDQRDIAERPLRGRTRGVRAHAISHQAIGLQIEVRLHFGGEISMSPGTKQGPHQPFAGSGPRTRAIAAARRRQRLDC